MAQKKGHLNLYPEPQCLGYQYRSSSVWFWMVVVPFLTNYSLTLKAVSLCRYLQQWVMVWNDFPGNIWITTALTLPNFHPPRILIAKQNQVQKNWYPTIIHKVMGKYSILSIVTSIKCFSGDRLGDNILHMYWRDHPNNHREGIFKKIKFEIFEEQHP